MGVHHWPYCDGNHPLGTACNGGHSARLKEQLAREFQAADEQCEREWEDELRAFGPAACPWVVDRGGYDALEPWEKMLLGNIYLNTGSFWLQRLGPYATRTHASRPRSWADRIQAQIDADHGERTR